MSESRDVIEKMMSGRTGNMHSYHAILLVSVGKNNFENNELKAAIRLINEEFHSCTIVIADTLQRYNIATERQISPEEAYEEALFFGDNWLKKHGSFFSDTFQIPWSILRWDALINDEHFEGHANRFQSIFSSSPQFQDSMDDSIKEGIGILNHLFPVFQKYPV